MTNIIDGRLLAKKVRADLKIKTEELKKKGIVPKLAVILVGDNEASKIYIRNKSRVCNKIGIEFEEKILEENISMKELLDVIDELNERKDISGILLQSPIPKHLDIQQAFQGISPSKDVDGFNPINIGLMDINRENFVSCTPLGILKMFEEYKIDIKGKKVLVIGRSNIVGRPMAQVLVNRDATVTVAHSKTKDLKELTLIADIIICAVGKPKLITADMVKEDVVVIDVGINRNEETGKLCGDVDYENVSKKASYITPVPGGVGPMTIAMLMSNVVKAAEKFKI